MDSGHTLKVKPTEFAYVLDVGYKINDLNYARKKITKTISCWYYKYFSQNENLGENTK